jgi:hypothetical protein
MTKVKPSTTDTSVAEPATSAAPTLDPRTGRTQLFYLPVARDKGPTGVTPAVAKRSPADRPAPTKTQIFGSDWASPGQSLEQQPSSSSAPFQTTTEARRPLHVAAGAASSGLEGQLEDGVPPPSALNPVTALHSVELLLARRAALLDAQARANGAAAPSGSPAPAARSTADDEPEALYRPPMMGRSLGLTGLRGRVARLSSISKLSLLMLPLLAALLIAGSVVKKGRPAAGAQRASSMSSAAVVATPAPPGAAQQAVVPAPGAQPLEPQDGLQRRAADAVAEGRYAAALELYRQLAAREPLMEAYPEAVRILESVTKPASP